MCLVLDLGIQNDGYMIIDGFSKNIYGAANKGGGALFLLKFLLNAYTKNILE